MDLILDVSLPPCIFFLLSQFKADHGLINVILICDQCVYNLLLGKVVVELINDRFNNDLVRRLFLWFLFFQLTKLLFLLLLKNHFGFLNRFLQIFILLFRYLLSHYILIKRNPFLFVWLLDIFIFFNFLFFPVITVISVLIIIFFFLVFQF